jgi:hypothetical protein
MSNYPTILSLALALTFAAGLCALAQDYDIDWHTIDCGGEMSSTGGGFELAGTIGQPDASSFDVPMTGGGFELVGGFWPVASSATTICACPGDVMPDSLINGDDIRAFVDCLLGAGSNCACADMDGVPGLDLADVEAFVQDLLAGTPCP